MTVNEYTVGMTIQGIVSELAAYGAFIECDGGAHGLLHISELSDKYVNEIGQFLKLGDRLTLKIIAIDPTNKFLRLSLKQCQQTPQSDHHKPIRMPVPASEINFKQLQDALPGWIETTLKKHEE